MNAVSRLRVRIPTSVRWLRDDPGWLPMFALARFNLVRRLGFAWSGVAARPARRCGTVFPAIDPLKVARDLADRGLCTGLMLPAATVQAIRVFADSTVCFGNFDRGLAFRPAEHEAAESKFGRCILVGHYFEMIERCAPIRELWHDHRLWEIAAAYLRAPPQLLRSRLWWSFVTDGAREADRRLASQQSFHFDIDDWRAVKFFFYLTDVDRDSGPHVYVERSHRTHKLAHQLTLFAGQAADDIAAAYGQQNVVTVCGEAGFGFAEDPFGFHMGQSARTRPRLILEIVFGVRRQPRSRFYGEP